MDRLPRRLRRPLSARSRQAATGRPVPAAAVATGAAILAGLSVIAAVAAGGPAASGSQAGRGGVVTGFAAGVSLGGRQLPAGDGAGPPVAGGQARPGGTVTAGLRQFRGIILPDLLVVVPAGLTSAQISGLTAIPGVSSMITFAGGRISAAGHPVSAIGVSPGQFRSWVPLRTASDRALWSGLAAGGFVAADGTAANLQLRPGASYQLTGRSAQDVRFAGLARLGIAGIDVLVGQQVSARLGLVHRVAALISAPGLGMSRLLASVRLITGPTARLVGLRSTRLPVATARPGQISSYLQLFRASAARYCPGLSWTVLAAIGQIESGDGQNMGPSSAGALGPMQFLPSTWAAWGIDGFGQTGAPDVMNPLDAVPSAARMLCAAGASGESAPGLRQAIFAYNHATWYVNEVLALAARYAASYS